MLTAIAIGVYITIGVIDGYAWFMFNDQPWGSMTRGEKALYILSIVAASVFWPVFLLFIAGVVFYILEHRLKGGPGNRLKR